MKVHLAICKGCYVKRYVIDAHVPAPCPLCGSREISYIRFKGYETVTEAIARYRARFERKAERIAKGEA